MTTHVDRRRLSRAPLALVALQLNYSEIDRKLLNKEVMSYRAALKEEAYGELTQVHKNQMAFQVSAMGGTSTSEVSRSTGWRLATRDQSWSVTLFQDSIILEAREQAYGDWPSVFRPRLETAIKGLAEVFQPELQTRIGLRYINALSHPEASIPTFWRGRIRDTFLGPLSDNALMDNFRNSNLRTTFEFENAQANLNMAFQPDTTKQGRTAVVFDTDVYRSDTKEFSYDLIIAEADGLNTIALQLFQRIISEAQLEELR